MSTDPVATLHPKCNCSYGDTPCRLYPASRIKGRTGGIGRCEGCAMGLHRGHPSPQAPR